MKDMNQRGIIFTLSVLLLALAVVALAQTIRENTLKAAENIQYAKTAEAVASKFQNLKENLVGLSNYFNRLDATLDTNRITVFDSMPRTDYNASTIFVLPVADYKVFASTYADAYTLTLDEEAAFDNFMRRFNPFDMLYIHGIKNGRQAAIVRPATTTFGSYEVTVNLNGRTLRSVTDGTNVEPVGGNGIDLTVKVKESSSGNV